MNDHVHPLLRTIINSFAVPPELMEEQKRSCNLHVDCNAADARARAAGRTSAEHCHDECCEECFGN